VCHMYEPTREAAKQAERIFPPCSANPLSPNTHGNLPPQLPFERLVPPPGENQATSAKDSLLPSPVQHSAPVRNAKTEETPKNHTQKDRTSVIATVVDIYFRPKAFEAKGTLYGALGVGYFKTVLMATIGLFFTRLKDKSGDGNNYCLGGHTLRDLKQMEWATRFNESLHIGAIALTNIPMMIEPLSSGQAPHWAMLALFTLNAYCIMLQRFNRERLYRAIDRAERRPSHRIPQFKLRNP
jgi:hypothetical protein